MKSFTPNLTAMALALHLCLGCCWHHAHCDIEPGANFASAGQDKVESLSAASCCDTDDQPCSKPTTCQGIHCCFFAASTVAASFSIHPLAAFSIDAADLSACEGFASRIPPSVACRRHDAAGQRNHILLI